MEKFRSILKTRFENARERGASAVEYGLLIAGIAAVIVVAVMALGPVIHDAFSGTCDQIKTSSAASGTNAGAAAVNCDN